MVTHHRSFLLDPSGPQRLFLSWEMAWNSIDMNNITIRIDDQALGTIATKDELRAGRTFQLPDGSALLVQWAEEGRKIIGWRLLRDGQPLPESATDPFTKIQKAARAVFFVAGINLLVGIISALVVLGSYNQAMRTMGIAAIIYGLLFLGLGFLVRRPSLIALLIAITLQTVDILTLLLFAAQRGANGTFLIGIVVKATFLVSMLRGVQAIRSVKR